MRKTELPTAKEVLIKCIATEQERSIKDVAGDYDTAIKHDQGATVFTSAMEEYKGLHCEALREENERLYEALYRLVAFSEVVEDTLFHHNLTLDGWHLNGDMEPIMNFVSRFDTESIEYAKQALKGG